MVASNVNKNKKKASTLRQLSLSLRYFVLSETLHCAIIKFGNARILWQCNSIATIKFAFTSLN